MGKLTEKEKTLRILSLLDDIPKLRQFLIEEELTECEINVPECKEVVDALKELGLRVEEGSQVGVSVTRGKGRK